MKKGMVFHFIFIVWLSYFIAYNMFFILSIPNNIGVLVMSYQDYPNHILEAIKTAVVELFMGGLCLFAMPILYQLINRVNLNLKKLNVFLWTYAISHMLLIFITPTNDVFPNIPYFRIILFVVDMMVAYVMINGIRGYYQNRATLFSIESKTFRRAKYKAIINRLTFGFVSFE